MKTFTCILIGIIQLVCSGMSAQSPGTYCESKWKADSLLEQKAYNSALQEFRHCLQYPESTRRDYYKLAVCSSAIKDTNNAANYFKQALERGLRYPTFNDFLNDSSLLALRGSTAWNEITTRLQENIDHIQATQNAALIKRLVELKIKDQAYRTNHKLRDSLMKANNQDELERLRKALLFSDSLNQLELKEIMNQYGWPGYSLAGEAGDNAAWAICQHADNNIPFQQYCLTKLSVALTRYDTNPANVAYITDRILVNSGKKQIYGTQFRDKRENGKIVDLIFKPIEDEAHVNIRRNCFGLYTLEKYKKYALEHFAN